MTTSTMATSKQIKETKIIRRPHHETKALIWAVVVVQLVERLLPNPEIRSSNLVNGKFYLTSTALNLYWKDDNKEKRGQEWPI